MANYQRNFSYGFLYALFLVAIIEHELLLLCVLIVEESVSNRIPRVGIQQTNVMELQTNCSLADFTRRAQCFAMRCEEEGALVEECSDIVIVCDGGLVAQLLESPKKNITNLQIRNWPGECLDFNGLQQLFPELKQLVLYRSKSLNRIWGKFDESSKIEHIILREVSALLELPAEAVRRMTNLKVLDMRKNGIQHLKRELIVGPPNLQRVYLRENLWHCSDGGLDWLSMENENGTVRSRLKDFDKLMCHQRLYKGKPMPQVMKFIKTVSDTCPSPCACNLTYVGLDSKGKYVPIVTVNCSNRALLEPPASLPPNTKTLYLQGNKISTIEMLIHNLDYRNVAEVYLDNNSISNLKELEGSDWLSTFHIFSLSWNRINRVPIFAFDSALQKNANVNGGGLYLGNNPYRCDCHHTPLFQDFLRKYEDKIMIDMKDIKCAEPLGRHFMIGSMPVTEYCFNNRQLYLEPLEILNIVLGVLIVLILSKFTFDYCYYKKTGKLPWISKNLG